MGLTEFIEVHTSKTQNLVYIHFIGIAENKTFYFNSLTAKPAKKGLKRFKFHFKKTIRSSKE